MISDFFEGFPSINRYNGWMRGENLIDFYRPALELVGTRENRHIP
jgi:hypothetical protein